MDYSFLPIRRVYSLLILGVVMLSVVVAFSAFSAQPLTVIDPPNVSCQTAPECFQLAVNSIKPTPSKRKTPSVDPVSMLKQLQTQFPDTVWAKRAGIHLGLLLTESDFAATLQYFQTALQDFPVLHDYIQFWTGKAQLHANDWKHAAQSFESVVNQVPVSLLRTDAQFLGGQARFQAGECALAIRLYTQSLKRDPRSKFAPQAWLHVGQCELTMKRPKKAFDALHTLWWQYPTKPESRSAQKLIQQHRLGDGRGPTSEERYKRGLALYKAASFAEAASEFQRFLKEVPKGRQYYEAQYKLGNAFARLKRYGQAEKIFQRLSTSKSRKAGSGTVWLARSYLRQDKGPQLLTLQSQAAARGASRNQQALIHIFSGVWLEDHGQYDQAIQSFQRAAKVGRSSRRKLDALWRVGWRHYQLEQYAQAISNFKEMQDIQDIGEEHARASYWMARSMDHSQQQSHAQTLYKELAQKVPFTYYGQLAQSRLLQPDSSVISTSYETLSSPSHPQGASPLLQDVRYQKASELVSLQLFQEAARELQTLIPGMISDKQNLSEFLGTAEQAQAYQLGIRIAIQRFGNKLKQGQIPQSSQIWTWAYPDGYLPTIRSFASPALDPYLVAGLIREESLYNPFAVSYVGALGLMQLMPTTADVVARRLGLARPVREELFNAQANIQLGTTYVNELLEKFKGNLVHTVAAYNAGPAAVNRWIARNEGKPADEFVESISYRETRGYVKRVLGSYRVYRTLGVGSCQAASLDRMC